MLFRSVPLRRRGRIFRGLSRTHHPIGCFILLFKANLRMDLCQERKNNILLKYFKRKFGKPKAAESCQNLKASRCYDCAAGQVPFRFGIALFAFRICILPKAAAEKRRGVYFLRRNPLRADKTVLTTAEDGAIVHTSFVKCFEQDTTSPDHRFQRAVGGAKRQQGTGRPSPVSSFGERRISAQ